MADELESSSLRFRAELCEYVHPLGGHCRQERMKEEKLRRNSWVENLKDEESNFKGKK